MISLLRFPWYDDNVGKTYGEGVDHGLEAEVDFAAADDLGDILFSISMRSA